MSDLKGVPKRVIVTADEAAYPTTLRAYADLIVHDGIVVKNRNGFANRPAADEEIASCKVLTPEEARIAIDAAAWRGEQPAEGTRRRIVLDAIKKGDVLSDTEALEIADTVELALLSSGHGEPATITELKLRARFGKSAREVDEDRRLAAQREADRLYRDVGAERGEESHVGPVGVPGPSGPDVKALCIAQRESHKNLRESDPAYAEYHRGAELAYALIAERLDQIRYMQPVLRDNPHLPEGYAEKLTAERDVPSGTRELRVVLEDVTEVDKPPEYRFVEIDNQDGASVGFPMVNSSTGSLKEVVIPYGRDDAWIGEVATQAAGAAFGVALEDHPDYVFPTERVSERVRSLLRDFDIDVDEPRAEELLEHGRQETGDALTEESPENAARRFARELIEVTQSADRLLEQREEARAGEGHWKAQRDAAFRLLQWVLPDLMGHPSDTLGADLADDAPEKDRDGAPDVLDLSLQARSALAARIEEGRCDTGGLIEIAKLA